MNADPNFDLWYETPQACAAAYNIYSAGWRAAQAEGANKQLIPWLGVSEPTGDASGYPGAEPGMQAIDYALAGLEHWSQVTDTAIITTKQDAVDYLYSRLPSSKPSGMTIIGGVATSSLLPKKWDFANEDAWKQITKCAHRIAELTEQRIVFLENENALKAFHTGEESITLGRLLAQLTLALLPLRDTGLQIWWNLPSVQSDEIPDRRRRTAELTAAMAEVVPNSLFLGGYAMRPGRRTDPDQIDRRAEMLAIVGPDRLIDRLMLSADEDPTCYSVEAAIVEAWTLPRGPVIVYPGAADWIRTGEQFVELLSP